MRQSMPDAELLRAYLGGRTIGCPRCDYNLRGISTDRCPECGCVLELQLASAGVPLGWWLAGLLSVALPLGFAFTFACAAMFGAWRSRFWSERDWWLLAALVTLTLFYSICLAAIIRRRQRFVRLPRFEQRLRAVSVMAIMVVMQFALFSVFRGFASF